ncbi:MAG: M20/M25/M40 family metallo-hydrolase [Acidobacteria bacterium]|nr:M20/M25/M40 family metallo-hydrolase [Acidobacteriota bacterium]
MRRLVCASILCLAGAASGITAQEAVDFAMVARIKEEGLQRSRVRELYLTLSDAFGARLTASPSYTQAARWARDRFAEWGLANARLEPFMFGRGWSLEKVSVEMTAPRYLPLIAYADAWTPSMTGVVNGRAVYVGDKTAAEIQAMAPQLRGAIVLARLPQALFMDGDRPQPGLSDRPVRTGNPVIPPTRSVTSADELLLLLQRAGAAVTLKPSAYRDGTVGVTGNRNTASDAVPSIAIAAEHYNMLARLASAGVPVELRIELRTRYHEDDLNTYNVLAEIPGTDPALRDEVVLVGAHLDSWHTGNGATDNGDGVVGVMEAMRILAALGVRPRRTIRAALWSGEEQGLLGARAYLRQHLADPAARDRLAVYLNDDPGSGRTLGFYMEGNAAAKAIFDAWLEPLKDLGMTRNIVEGIGATDHVPFNEAGLPGFNAIKDFEAYDERTRHTNADFPERVTDDELKQSAIVLAVFAWHAAVRDGKIPRAVRP